MELIVVNDPLNFLSYRLHVGQQLFKVILELNFSGLKLEPKSRVVRAVVFKPNCSLN